MGDAAAATAAQVSRLREERGLLRRAVRDQQQKNANLETRVQTTESALREATHEVDRLAYENERLAARLKQTQNQLEEVQPTRPGVLSGGSMLSSFINVTTGTSDKVDRLIEQNKLLETEFTSKIRETERVHVQLFDERQEHQLEITDLKYTLDTTQSTVKQLQTAINEAGKQAQQNRATEQALRTAVCEREVELHEARRWFSDTIGGFILPTRHLTSSYHRDTTTSAKSSSFVSGATATWWSTREVQTQGGLNAALRQRMISLLSQYVGDVAKAYGGCVLCCEGGGSSERVLSGMREFSDAVNELARLCSATAQLAVVWQGSVLQGSAKEAVAALGKVIQVNAKLGHLSNTQVDGSHALDFHAQIQMVLSRIMQVLTDGIKHLRFDTARLSQLILEMSDTLIKSTNEPAVEHTDEDTGRADNLNDNHATTTYSRAVAIMPLEENSSVKSELRNPFADYEEEEEYTHRTGNFAAHESVPAAFHNVKELSSSSGCTEGVVLTGCLTRMADTLKSVSHLLTQGGRYQDCDWSGGQVVKRETWTPSLRSARTSLNRSVLKQWNSVSRPIVIPQHTAQLTMKRLDEASVRLKDMELEQRRLEMEVLHWRAGGASASVAAAAAIGNKQQQQQQQQQQTGNMNKNQDKNKNGSFVDVSVADGKEDSEAHIVVNGMMQHIVNTVVHNNIDVDDSSIGVAATADNGDGITTLLDEQESPQLLTMLADRPATVSRREKKDEHLRHEQNVNGTMAWGATTVGNSQPCVRMVNVLGQLLPAVGENDDIVTQIENVRSHFIAEVLKREDQLQEAEARFKDSETKVNDAVTQMQSMAEDRKRHMRQKLQWKNAMTRARTELDSTRSNYDAQLKAITEHACQLENEAVAKSQDIARLQALVERLKGETFFTQQ